jgi:hypothetical protein
VAIFTFLADKAEIYSITEFSQMLTAILTSDTTDSKHRLMTKDINDFITFDRLKNGRVKITHDINNEGNIYKHLHELGYRKAKLDNKRVYFRREGTELTPLSIREIKVAFRDYLRNFDFTNIPDDIEYFSILNWYYERQPIKENGLLDHYLEDELNESEVHYLRLKTNVGYKHKKEIENLLSKFEEWSFSKTIDNIGSICLNAPLYYKKIGDKKYLVFSHYNSEHKTNNGFDCWIATFVNEKQIGKKKPSDIETIRFSFQLDRDFGLISDYVS